MSQQFSDDVLELSRIVNSSNTSIPNKSSVSTDLSFTEIEKHMSLNSAQIPYGSFQLDNEIHPHHKDHINIELPTDLNIDFLTEPREGSHISAESCGSYNSSPESSFPYTPVDSLDSCTSGSMIEQEIGDVDKHKDITLGNYSDPNNEKNAVDRSLLSNFSLDQEIEQIVSATTDFKDENISTKDISNEKLLKRSFHNNSNKKNKDKISLHKRQKISEPLGQENKYLQCFSILRTNYLSLCESYNQMVDKLSACEEENKRLKNQSINLDQEKDQWKIDKDRILLEREEMKSMLDSLLHEVIILRRKENENIVNSSMRKIVLPDNM